MGDEFQSSPKWSGLDVNAGISVERLIDVQPVWAGQVLIAAAGTLALVAAGIGMQILSYLMPEIASEWGSGPQFQGIILSIVYAGTMVGYILLGSLASRFGLKSTSVSSLLAMGVLLILSSFAQTVLALTSLRFLTGVALGGVVPPVVALIAEYYPTRLRSSIVSIIHVGMPMGFLIAGWLSWLIIPRYGWRMALVAAGCITLLITGLVTFALRESLDFLISRKKNGLPRALNTLNDIYPRLKLAGGQLLHARSGAGRPDAGVLDLFREGRALGTGLLWVSLIANSMVYFVVQSWLPSMLVRIGVSQQNAILASALGTAGGIISAFVVGPLMDRYGPYRVISTHFILGAMALIIVADILSPALLFTTTALFALGYCVSGLQKSISALAMHFYPTELRSPGLGWVLSVGRIGAIMGPIVAGWLMAGGQAPSTLFYFMVAPCLSGSAAIAIMSKRYATAHPRAFA